MPIIKSAKKRVRTQRKATVRNAKAKRALKIALKDFAKSPSAKTLSAAQSEIDTATKKNVIHANKAARLKSRAAAVAKAAGVKPSAAKKTAAKPTSAAQTSKKEVSATKKKAPAKAPTKKPATKKTPAKKPAAK